MPQALLFMHDEERRTEETMHGAGEELEKQVEERTTELTKANVQLRQEISRSKEVEATLRESEEQFRLLGAAAPVGIFQADIHGQCLYVNERWQEISGLTPAESLGNGWTRALHPEDRAELLAAWAAAMHTGQEFARECRLQTPQNEVRWVHTRSNAMCSAEGTVIGHVGTVEDITARRQTENALRRSEEQYRSFFENALEGIFRSTPAGGFTQVNPALVRMLGYESAEEVLALKLPDDLYVDPTQRARLRAAFDSPGKLEGIELQWKKKSSELLTVLLHARAIRDEHGLVSSYEGMVVDVTARKQAEEALRESEERYRALFENANDAIVTNTLEGIVTSVNRGLERLLGWTREELLGQHYRKFVTPAAVALGEERTRRFLAGERLSSIFEAEMVRKDGSVVPVEARTRMIRDREGKFIGIQGIHRDISARKALEQQHTDFLAMLTHDIKNPLSVILGYTEILLEQAEAEGRTANREDILGRIKNNALTVHSLVTNHLDLFRIEAGQLILAKKPLQLNDLLLHVGQQYEIEAQQQHLTFDIQLQPDLPLIEADGVALERVFTNLLHNALKFTPKGRRITIHSARHNGAVIASIADTGPGLAPEEIPLLFEKYRRTERSKHQTGTGLGLFIVKSVVEAHGGRVTVDSTLGVGTCFSVFLPVGAVERG